MIVGFRIDKDRGMLRRLISKIFTFYLLNMDLKGKNNSISDFSIFKITDIKNNLKIIKISSYIKYLYLIHLFQKFFQLLVKKRHEGKSSFKF